MTQELNILIARSEEINSGSFVVARLKTPPPGPFNQKNTEHIFRSDGSLADHLFGWGIARLVSSVDKYSLILFHPGDNVVVPRNAFNLNSDSGR